MDADALGRAVVNGDEDGDLPVLGVKAAVISVPNMVSIVSGTIVPSWLRGPQGELARLLAERLSSRIRRRTRSLEVRRP